MQDRDDGCLICSSPYTEEHHVFFGTANRKLSDKYGLLVYLCAEHHRGQNGVHFDKKLDDCLKKAAQIRFEETYPDKDFRQIFGRNYK